nr:MAG TPA: hypothetical protein [Caudoviricetes sp.]
MSYRRSFASAFLSDIQSYTVLGYSSNPINTPINTDNSPTFIFDVYLQLKEVRAYHVSCLSDTILLFSL